MIATTARRVAALRDVVARDGHTLQFEKCPRCGYVLNAHDYTPDEIGRLIARCPRHGVLTPKRPELNTGDAGVPHPARRARNENVGPQILAALPRAMADACSPQAVAAKLPHIVPSTVITWLSRHAQERGTPVRRRKATEQPARGPRPYVYWCDQ